MTLITKEDIQQLASQSNYLGTGDLHRVKAVLKQLDFKPLPGKISELQYHEDRSKFYFILDIVVSAPVLSPVKITANLKTLIPSVFFNPFIIDIPLYKTDSACDTLSYSINRIVQSLNIDTQASVLYYELTKF